MNRVGRLTGQRNRARALACALEDENARLATVAQQEIARLTAGLDDARSTPRTSDAVNESFGIMREQLNDAATVEDRLRDQLREAHERIGWVTAERDRARAELESVRRSLGAARAEIARAHSVSVSPQ